MRGLPDSAVLGTAKRLKRVGRGGRPVKGTAKKNQQTADALNSMIYGFLQSLTKKR